MNKINILGKKGVSSIITTVLFIAIVVAAIAVIGVVVNKSSSKLQESLIRQEIATDCKAKNLNDEIAYNNCVIQELQSKGINVKNLEGGIITPQAGGPPPVRSLIRTLPGFYSAGIPLIVKLNLTLLSIDCTAAIVETLPLGWNATNIKGPGNGIYNPSDNKIRWAPINGSACSGQNGYLFNYTATPNSSQSGTKTFDGSFSVDGTSAATTGNITISPLGGGGQSLGHTLRVSVGGGISSSPYYRLVETIVNGTSKGNCGSSGVCSKGFPCSVCNYTINNGSSVGIGIHVWGNGESNNWFGCPTLSYGKESPSCNFVMTKSLNITVE